MHKNIITQEENIPTTIGQTTNITWDNSKELLKEIGWRLMPSLPELQEGFTRTSIVAVEGDGENGIWEVIDVITTDIPEPSFDISKLKLGRAFRAIGQETNFEAYLASDSILLKDWERAVSLRSDDPLVVSACALFKQTLGMTDEQLSTMLKQCKSELI